MEHHIDFAVKIKQPAFNAQTLLVYYLSAAVYSEILVHTVE